MSVLNFEDVGLYALHARDLISGSKQTSVFGVGIAFSTVGILVMSLRIYCRIHIISCGLGMDDCEPGLACSRRFLPDTPCSWTDFGVFLDLMLVGVICNVGLSTANMICESSLTR